MATNAGDFWQGGGGIYNGDGATLKLSDSAVSGNTAAWSGGGIYSFFNTTTTIVRSTISGNTSNDVGGAIRSLGAMTITNSTLSGNTATGWHGGAIFQTTALRGVIVGRARRCHCRTTYLPNRKGPDMRRKLLAPVIGALVLLGSMLPATALGVTAGQSPVVDTASVDHLLPRIRLGCVLIQPDATPTTDSVVPDVAPAITCRWSAVDSPRVFVYQLWRIRDAADGGSRRLIARVRPGDALRYRDVRVKAGHTYTYKVVARAASGRKIAASRLVTVRIPRPDEVLRMACAPATVGDRQGVVCKWSEATHPRAARYVLWRSVDGGAREKVFRTGLDGRRWHFDTDVEAGQTIRYAVVVKSRAGHRVGLGGPVVVEIPGVEAPATRVVTGAR